MRQQTMAKRGAVGGRRAWMLIRVSGGVLFGLVAAGTVHAQACVPVSGIERLSVAGDGTPGNASSEIPAVSADGCIVAFKSFASNLVASDTNDKVDVFVRDRGGPGSIERIPLVPFFGTEPKDNSYPPALDALGEIVGFGSLSNNLVANDFNQQSDVFAYTRNTASTQALSLAQGGDGGGRVPDQPPSVSADGKWVVLTSAAGDLVPDDDNQTNDVFLVKRDDGSRVLVSQATVGSVPGTSGNGSSGGGAISADDCYVAFYSLASNLVPNDTNNDRDVFLRHVCAPEFTERVNVTSSGQQAVRPTDRELAPLEYPPAISGDGRFVAFLSDQRNLETSDTGIFMNIFVRDRKTPESTTLLTRGINGGPANGPSKSVSISEDGRFVVFQSNASNLVDDDTNDHTDVFVVHLPSHAIQIISVNAPAGEWNGDSTFPQISADGKSIVFQSDGTNLIDGTCGAAHCDTNGVSDIFMVANPLFSPPPTPTPTAGDSCGAICSIGQGCRRSVDDEIQPGECVPDRDCLCIVGGTETPTATVSVSVTVTPTATMTGVVTATVTPTPSATFTPTAGDSCGAVCSVGQGCRRQVGGQILPGACVPDQDCLCIVGGTVTPTPTAGDSCGAVCRVGQGCRRQVGGEILPGDCVPDQNCLCIVGGTATPTPTAGDSCGAVCSVGQGCRRQVGGQILPGACVPDQNCLCIVGGTATPTPTAGDSCGAVCSVGQGCRRQVGGQILPGACVPDQNCLCIVGGTATPTGPTPSPILSATTGPSNTPTKSSATATPTSSGGGGGGGGGGCGCRIDPSTGRVADSTQWPALAVPAMAWFWRRRQRQS